MTSQRQIDANRRNAQKSNGPKTPEGRAAVRFNALRHGLTAQHAVLSDEDKNQFNQTLKAFQQGFQPVGPTENFLVHQIVMAAWRLQHIRGIETGFFELLLPFAFPFCASRPAAPARTFHLRPLSISILLSPSN